MTDPEEKESTPVEQASPIEPAEAPKPERFPELAELQEQIQRRLRSNQRFLERFMDEDFEGLDDEDAAGDDGEDDDPETLEEL